MPETVRVWAVELEPGREPKEREGNLSLEEDHLRFEPQVEGRPPIALPLAGIQKARRLRGSPVLMVVSRRADRAVRTAFYFAQPPPLDAFADARTESRTTMPSLRNPKRKARRQNVGYLGIRNRELKGLVVEWERAVRAAVTDARGASGT